MPLLMPASGGDVSRRRFLLGVAASSVGAVLFTGCQVPPHELQEQSALYQPEDLAAAAEDWYATACRLCPGGCGVLARVVDGRARKMEGNPDHPVNRGKLCARGQAAVQNEYHPDRVSGPLLRRGTRGAGGWLPISWNEGLDRLAAALGGPQASGQTSSVVFLTQALRGHEAFLVDRFTTTYGAQWLTQAPLGEAAFRSAAQRVFGTSQLPSFDLANARSVLAFGADFLESWLAPVYYSVGYGLFRHGSYQASSFQPRTTRGRLVYVGPRLSATAASADEWVYVRPGQEGLLALSMAQVLLGEGLADSSAAGLFGGSGGLDAYQPETVQTSLGVPADRIRRLAREFASNRPALALGGGVAGAHTNGTDALSAILALNLLVGAVGQPGGVGFAPPPPVPGIPQPRVSTLSDWLQLRDGLRTQQVQTVLIHRANPVHRLPAALGFSEALQRAPTIISFSSFLDDTTLLADLVLPTHLPLEDWGDDIPEVAGAPVVTLQQPVVLPLHDTRGFGDVLLAAAGDLGGSLEQALPWPTYKDLLREVATQLQQAPGGSVQASDPQQFWTTLLQRGVWTGAPSSVPPSPPGQVTTSLAPAEFAGDPQIYPYVLLPFAHPTLGEGDGAHLPWLQAAPDPMTSVVWQTWVELHPQVADRLGVHEGDIVRVEAPTGGTVEVPVYVSPAASPEVVAMPLGQGHTGGGRWASGRGVNPLQLLSPAVDSTSGDLAYAATRVRLVATGRHVPLPKFEGDVVAYQLPGKEVLKVTNA